MRLYNYIFNSIINSVSFKLEYYQYNNGNLTILLYVRYNEILEKMLNYNESNLVDLDRSLSNSK